MREINENEQKKVSLDILKYLKKICDENNINYSLTGGTLLGAIRHQGFIPWDDDIDVFLSRPEYKKLEQVLEKNKGNQYLWLNDKHDKNYHFNFGRLVDSRTIIKDEGLLKINGYGVFVDVCVVDGLPNNILLRWLHIIYMRFLYHARSSATYTNKEYVPKNIFKRILKMLFQKYTCYKGVRYWHNKIEKNISKYPFDKGKYVGNVTSQYGFKEVMHRSSFNNYINIEFEHIEFKIINGWEEYLKNIYGDYMQLPPENKRIGHHLGTVYWKK